MGYVVHGILLPIVRGEKMPRRKMYFLILSLVVAAAAFVWLLTK